MASLKSNTLTLYHGSATRVERPRHGVGNPHNDYGLGFYCTESKDLACEWACPDTTDGYVNEYELNVSELRFFDFDTIEHSCLHWLAILVANRRFDVTTPLMEEALRFMLEHYLIDLNGFDVITGYRADDSYFSFARAFLDNRISLNQLSRALYLGDLGTQTVIKSPKGFESLTCTNVELVEGALWHPRRRARDERARSDFRTLAHSKTREKDEVFILDLLRGAQ